MLLALINIVSYLASIFSIVVLVMFVLSLLLAFNVVNTGNHFVMSIWRAVNAILDPFLNPIRRILPQTGGVDFSPMVLLIGLRILIEILYGLQRDMMMY